MRMVTSPVVATALPVGCAGEVTMRPTAGIGAMSGSAPLHHDRATDRARRKPQARHEPAAGEGVVEATRLTGWGVHGRDLAD
jgi:hypothetical protein